MTGPRLSGAVWRSVPWLAGIAAATAWTVMAEISRLLARLEQAGTGSWSANAFTGWPGLPPWSAHRATDAIAHWSKVAGEIGLRDETLGWLHAHLLLDSLVFVPAYTVLLWFAVAAAGLANRVWAFAVLAAFVLDQAETWTTGCSSGISAMPRIRCSPGWPPRSRRSSGSRWS